MPAIVQNKLGYVVLGHLAAYFLGGAVVTSYQRDFLATTLLLSEQALLFIWAGVGTGRWLPRLAIAYGLCAFGWYLLVFLQGRPVVWYMIACCVMVAFLLSCHLAPLVFARTRGFHLWRFGENNCPMGRAFRISLRTLPLVTVIAASLLAFGASIGDEVVMRGSRTFGSSAISRTLLLVGLPTLLTSSALLSVWAVFSAGEPISRIVVGTATVAAGGAFLPYCLSGDARAYAFWCGLAVSLFLIVSASLFPFRVAGYRFMQMRVPEVNLLAKNAVPSETDEG